FSFLHSSSARLDLPSFPTRRSSDLNLVKTMRRIRRSISAHSLAQSCNEEALYTLGDLCEMAGLAPQSLEDRMALAKVLYQHPGLDRKSTRLNSSHVKISYAVFCLKK